MASAAPAQTKCGVTVCIPSGIGFTWVLLILISPLLLGLRTFSNAGAVWARLLLLRRYLRAQALLLLPQLGRKLGAEVLRLEQLADLDLAILVMRIGTALDP